MGIGKQRTSLAVRERVELVIVLAAVELDVRVAQVVLEALVGLAVQAAQAA